MMDIRQEVRRLVKEQIGWHDDQDIADDLSKKDAGFDSLDDIEMIMALEERFDIEIKDSVAEKLNTINDIVKYVEHFFKYPF